MLNATIDLAGMGAGAFANLRTKSSNNPESSPDPRPTRERVARQRRRGCIAWTPQAFARGPLTNPRAPQSLSVDGEGRAAAREWSAPQRSPETIPRASQTLALPGRG